MIGWTKALVIGLLPVVAGLVVLLLMQPAVCPINQVSATALATPTSAPTLAPLVDAPKLAPQCLVGSAVPGDLLVRSYPGAEFAELGTLVAELTALGLTDDGWVTVNYGERRGWLRAENLRFSGVCAALPRVRNPLIPVAAPDAEVFALQVDRDGDGSFRNTISTPEGDALDILWVVIINLYTQPPNNLREFTLTLDCDGAQPDAVRWGWAYETPTLTCGDALTLPFTLDNPQQPFSITYAPNSPQSYINYVLRVSGGAAG